VVSPDAFCSELERVLAELIHAMERAHVAVDAASLRGRLRDALGMLSVLHGFVSLGFAVSVCAWAAGNKLTISCDDDNREGHIWSDRACGDKQRGLAAAEQAAPFVGGRDGDRPLSDAAAAHPGGLPCSDGVWCVRYLLSFCLCWRQEGDPVEEMQLP